MYKAFFDGSITKNPGGDCSYGVCIYDEYKKIFEESSPCGSGVDMTNNVAEYRGLIRLLRYFIDNNLTDQQIKIYGDSELVIRQMIGQYKIGCGAYAKDAVKAKLVSRLFWNIGFQWIPREQNIECDYLSNPKKY